MSEVFGKQLGQYVLLEQLGEGGMAKVFNAFDARVERNVAIKVILPSKRTSKVFLQQFEREAKALANLAHTNIVKVLNYGIQDGQPYLVMEYVPGGTLKDAMHQKIPWQTAAAILAPIARALDYVHQQQIVHRDVKPSNILLQEDFSPMLSDFGILKMLEGKEEKVDAAIGAGVGTPEYMPPEQGLGREVDFRADIYSLGLVFYEMVTGQKPFTADSPMAIVIKHVTDELPLPTALDRNIPKFVERAILRAVQKNPNDRYLSMGHFADVLELIALGDKALERKIIKVSKQKEQRKHSFSIYALSALLVLLAAGTAFFGYRYFFGTDQAQATLEPAAPVANLPSETAAPTQSPANPILPTSTLPPAASPTAGPAVNPLSDLTLLQTPIAQNRGSQFNEIARWGIGGVNVVEWSPDGEKIALGATSGIFLYDAQSRDLLLFINTQFNVVELAFNPAAEEITAGSPTGLAKTWSSATGQLLQNFSFKRPANNQHPDSGAVSAISYSPDGQFVAIGFKKGAINYFPIRQGTALHDWENYPAVEALAISADNRFIYASNGTANIDIWDIQNNRKSPERLVNPTPVNNFSLSADRQFLLAGGSGNSVYFWDLFDSKQINSFPNPGARVADFDFSFDQKYVAVGLATGVINIFETPSLADFSKTLVPIKSYEAFSGQILSLAFAPDQLTLAAGNHAEGLKLSDALSGEITFALGQSLPGITDMHFSGDGLWLATAHQDTKVRLWDVNAGREAQQMDGYLPRGRPFSPDNRYLLTVYSPGRNRADILRVYDLKQKKVVMELPNFIPRAFVQFTDDTKLLVMGDVNRAVLWDVSTWEQLNTHGGPTAGCGQFFTPHNDLLAVISRVGILFAYDQKVEKLCGTKPENLTSVYYFYQQHRIVFVRGNGETWVWDFVSDEIGKPRPPGVYPVPGDIFLAAEQSSGWYAYADEHRVVLRNLSGAAGTVIDYQDDYRYRVALLPEKNLMALGSRYGSIHIWTMP
jgi:serine/threonine protein kinase/WD40 repeat protein